MSASGSDNEAGSQIFRQIIKKAIHIRRHNGASRTVNLFGKGTGTARRFQIQFDRMAGAVMPDNLDEPGRRIDGPGRSDLNEQSGHRQRLFYALHFERHLAEPDHVRSKTTRNAAGRARRLQGQVFAARLQIAASGTALLQQLAMHMDQVL